MNDNWVIIIAVRIGRLDECCLLQLDHVVSTLPSVLYMLTHRCFEIKSEIEYFPASGDTRSRPEKTGETVLYAYHTRLPFETLLPPEITGIRHEGPGADCAFHLRRDSSEEAGLSRSKLNLENNSGPAQSPLSCLAIFLLAESLAIG